MPARSGSSTLMRPFVVLALPGMYLLYKYNQYRQQQMETARRRVTERELMHLNTKILPKVVGQRGDAVTNRSYAKSGDGCRKALVDIPPEVDPICPKPCEPRKPKKKEGILHKIKLKMIEGGTNFGTPFRFLKCEETCDKKDKKEEPLSTSEPKALPPPKRKVPPVPEPRQGMQVSVLGADTAIGQYVALLLKQCPCIKKLRLYEAKDSQGCTRSLGNVVHDLHHIDTNCKVQAFSCSCNELERCLQNTDIVLMLESGYLNVDMPFEKRFSYQAPIVKRYADIIAAECPKAFVIVCASPIDCMVPLIAETMKETGWHDPRRLLGSLAVPEMRASTLAARALCLEPRYTRVPCVGGTEGETLVPLFSKAVEYFDFAGHNALLMTDAVRHAPIAVARSEGDCLRAADLSEAHALAGLVIKVAHALLCHDVPRLTGFVESDGAHVISPARFIAHTVELNGHGIHKYPGMERMNHRETTLVDKAVIVLDQRLRLTYDWYTKYRKASCITDAYSSNWFTPKKLERYQATDLMINHKGVCKQIDLPPRLSEAELQLLDMAFIRLVNNVNMAKTFHATAVQHGCRDTKDAAQIFFGKNKTYDRVLDCSVHLTS